MLNLAKRALRRLMPMPATSISGYEHDELVETVFRKTAAYAAESAPLEIHGARTVLDFGGGCGVHYKEARSDAVRWAVVETPAMARRASELQTDNLRFFTEIDAALAWLGPVDLMHSSGAVQYASDPIACVRQLCGIGAKILLWRRLWLNGASPEQQKSRLLDNGPGRLPGALDKTVSYTRYPMRADQFMAAHFAYRLVSSEKGTEGAAFRFEISP